MVADTLDELRAMLPPGLTLDACQDTAASEVNKRNAKKFFAWISSPIRRWGQISDAVEACMAGKGYRR